MTGVLSRSALSRAPALLPCAFMAFVWIASATPALAQPNDGPRKWWNSESVRRELKLTTEQTTQIEQIFQSSTERLRTDKEELERARRVLSQLMARPEADDAEITRVIDRVEMARYAM